MVNVPEHPSYVSFPVFRSLDSRPASRLDRFLCLFADVRGGEGAGALLLFANIFLLLSAYYLLKTAREPLILTEQGAVVKTYLSAGQALLLVVVIPLYSWVASKLKRVWLLSGISVFFAANLAAFHAAAAAGNRIGIPFYLWVGIFNVFAISQFWAFANDLYTEPQGKRLFPLIGVGASLGAVAGARAAADAVKQLGALPLLVAGGVLLLVCALLTVLADRRISERAGAAQLVLRQQPLGPGDGFLMILQDRYLVMIAFLVLLLNVVNTSGEFLLSSLVTEQAASVAGAGPEFAEARRRFIGSFFGEYFFWVNTLSFLFQAFLVSRLFRHLGVGGTLFILPLIAFTGYSLLLAAPVLGVIRLLKIVENSADYSIQNTARQALFLPTAREVKYKAKAAIDTFFQRAGDVAQAGIVWAGTNILALSISGFALLNLALTVVWLLLVMYLAREYRKRSAAASAGPPAAS